MGDSSVGYVGWGGNNNVGDDAIYYAIKRSREEITLKPSEFADASTTILAGGTILPLVFQDSSSFGFVDRNKNIALGVGVAEPNFENRPRNIIDLRYVAGKVGIDTSAIFNCLGDFGKGVCFIGNRLPGIKMDGVYCFDRDFRRTKEALDIITTRGPRSKRVLSEFGIKSEIVGDTALLLTPKKIHPDSKKKITLTLRTPGHGRKWTHNEAYIYEIMKFCRSIPTDVKKVFLPFEPVDIPLHKKLASNIPNAEWHDYTSIVDIDSILTEIANSEIVVGEKLHASVLAACCHTPCISLEYAPKNADFMGSMNMSELNVRIDNIDAATLSELYDTARSYDENEIKSQANTFRKLLNATLKKI